VAVDGAGNVYISDTFDSAIKEWNASTRTVSTLVSSGLVSPVGVAVGGAGNVYIADGSNEVVKELPRAFVPGGPITEGFAAGSDALPVLPTTESLTGIFAPTSDQSWLTIGNISNGVINFAFTANTGRSRTGHLTVLGQSIAVTQAAAATAPTVTNPTSTDVTATTATLGGTVSSDGGAMLSERGVLYSTSNSNLTLANVGNGVTKLTATGTTGDFTVSATDLSAGTQYYFVAYATNSVGTSYTSVAPFTTQAPTATNTALQASTSSSVYGQSVTFTATVTGGGPVTVGSVSFLNGASTLATVNVDGNGQASYSTSALPVAGSPYTITAVYNPSGNYQTSSGTTSLSVTPAPLSVTADSQSMVYGSAVPTLTGTLTGVVNGDNITVSYSTTATSSSDVIAGGYAITAILNDPDNRLGNYNVTNTPGVLTITTANQTISWSNPADIVYGTALSSTQLNGTVSVVGPAPAGALTYSQAAGTVLNAGAGQTLTVTAAATQDYNAASASVTINVTPAPLSVTVDSKSMVYGSAVPTLTGTLTGVVNGDNITASYSTTANSSSHVAGSPYAITTTLNDPDGRLGNYTVTNTAGTLTVTPAPLTITANDASKVYGAALPALSASYSGFVNGDSAASLTTQPTLTTTATAASQVAGSPYAITASGAVDSDYTISYVAGSLTVTPATPTVVVSGYTGGTYDGTAHTQTVTVTGVPADGQLYTTSVSATSAGNYSQAWSFSSNPNYAAVNGSLSFTIGQATPTVVVSGYTGGTYNGNAHTQTVTVTGVPADGQLYTTSLTGTNAGSYSQGWSFSSNSNYSAVSGTLSFTTAKANATISVPPSSVTYDGNAHTAAGSATGVKGESLSGLNLSGTTHTNAGSYTDTWTFTDSTGN
jgi:hypothetical protein